MFPMSSERIVVAMSGGVDSSAAAALLADSGQDVIGIALKLTDHAPDPQRRFGRCCSAADISDARRAAERIGIPFYVLDLEEEFEESVVAPFVSEYARGRTPLPCAHCNTQVKFDALVRRAQAFGASKVATGHYARIETDPASGRKLLLRGADPAKDQSYFLFGLTQEQLELAAFPVGDLRKEQVRAEARRRGLPNADKPESQEICFVTGSVREFLDQRLPQSHGEIVDRNGQVVGQHRGMHGFTVGQRRGLGLNARGSLAGRPLYVTAIEPETQRVQVGDADELLSSELVAEEINWIMVPPAVGQTISARVRIRYRHPEAPATITLLGAGCARVVFDQAQRAVTPGQAAVFYRGDQVLGGGWIA
jgi:tRNA-specific 2-thiouridylase